ncbi:MAG: cell division protein ZapA [Bacteroidota bacterium]
MKDQLSIKVTIAGRIYPLTIERLEEENVRKAVKLINEKVSEYQRSFNDKDTQDFLVMTCLPYVTQSLELQRNSQRDDKSVFDRLEKIDKAVSAELKD